MNDDLSLVVGSRRIGGWQAIRVTRGMERCPNDFEISMTDISAEDVMVVSVNPGDACQVFLGDDLVVTGYVDQCATSIDGMSHSINVIGRGKCQDLVDCAAEWEGGQFSNMTVADIAAGLASVYGIEVEYRGDSLDVVPQFNLMLGESPYEIIERVCRFKALLPYEGPDGNLILSQASKEKHASGFKQGVNVEQATAIRSQDQEYSDYHAYMLGFNIFKELGEAGNLISVEADENVTRNRKKFIIMEGGDAGQEVTIKRLQWEKNRRIGRSNSVRITTDGWRDSSGSLYEPNKLIDLELPVLKIENQTWTVSEVSYRRDGSGTHCDILAMPTAAFLPEPILLVPVLAELSAQQ